MLEVLIAGILLALAVMVKDMYTMTLHLRCMQKQNEVLRLQSEILAERHKQLVESYNQLVHVWTTALLNEQTDGQPDIDA